MLPTASITQRVHSGAVPSSSSSSGIDVRDYHSLSSVNEPEDNLSFFLGYFRRLFQLGSMDVEYTFFQMFYLCSEPQRVYRTTIMHESAKKRWARDDPAFVVLLMYFIAVSSFAYAIAFNSEGPVNLLRITLSTVVVDFLLVGVVASTVTWLLGNQFLRSNEAVQTDINVEWLYAFDVHCNAFFPLFLIIYVIQYFLLPILLISSSFFSTVVANFLYFAAFSIYFYHTFLGFNALRRIIENPIIFLYPILLVVVVILVLTLGNFNLSIWVINGNFAHH